MKQKVGIIGDGLTGLTAALILSKLNINVHLIGSQIKQKTKDNRTTAISPSNYDFLINNMEKKYSNFFWPVKKIDLYQEAKIEYEHFMDFENDEKNLMYIIENNKLKKIIKKEINKNKNIKIFKKEIKKINIDETQIYFGNEKINYDVILICTGKNSKIVGDLVGYRSIYQNTNEIAFTSIVRHKLDIINARQYFLKEGPLAILPIDRKKFSLVWSIRKSYDFEKMRYLIKAKLKKILKSKENISFSNLDFFPISFNYNKNVIKRNFLVLGDGSYNVHPVAGQGFNLILRDIICLQRKLEKHLITGLQLKDSLVLKNFSNERKPENLFFGLGINLINSFFKHNQLTQPLKKIILKDINKFKFLKDLSLDLSNRGFLNKFL